MIIIGLLVLYTQTLQSLAKDRLGGRLVRTYSELGYACYGPNGKKTVDICLLTSQIMLGIGCLVFIGKSFGAQNKQETRQIK